MVLLKKNLFFLQKPFLHKSKALANFSSSSFFLLRSLKINNMEAVQFKLLLLIFLTAFLLMPSIQAQDSRNCTNENYQVQVTRATVTLEPVVGGKFITFTLSAFTDQAIFEGEVVIDLSFKGVHFHSEKYVLCHDLSCPISAGNFAYSFSQVLSVNVAPGNYNFMMQLLSKDGRRLSCVAFDFTIPYEVTFNVTAPS